MRPKSQTLWVYLIEDIFSRKIVGWDVYESETGEFAAVLLQKAVCSERCVGNSLVLHSDNGSPMKSFTLQAKMYELGVTKSRSRPRVSNDNPFSESLFRTLKYDHTWPTSGFSCIDDARKWVIGFVSWYNILTFAANS
ncbi:MAG: DDE-type integrase/transposase/recombinase [Cellvibrionaceae bacterium]|nr:DDE-type integrase/transposase/recombinase [Cellvibrionaceae bacterium]